MDPVVRDFLLKVHNHHQYREFSIPSYPLICFLGDVFTDSTMGFITIREIFLNLFPGIKQASPSLVCLKEASGGKNGGNIWAETS